VNCIFLHKKNEDTLHRWVALLLLIFILCRGLRSSRPWPPLATVPPDLCCSLLGSGTHPVAHRPLHFWQPPLNFRHPPPRAKSENLSMVQGYSVIHQNVRWIPDCKFLVSHWIVLQMSSPGRWC
jgi:hypothetical protein